MPPFIPLTWRNVSGPSNAAALDMMRKSGQDLGSAIEGLGTNVEQFADEKQKRETDEFIAELGALPDDAARQDALKKAETGWMNLDRINKATTDLQAEDYTTAASARAQILGDIDVKTAQRKEESRKRTNAIMSNRNLSQAEFNAAALKHTQEGFADTGGVLKQRANEFARNTDTGITEDFIKSYVDPENNESYTRATYNTLVNDTYNKLKEAHPFADESVLRKQAKAAITRTEAGTLFEEQGWYEKLTPDKKDIRDESTRKQAVRKTWRDSTKAITKSFNTLKNNKHTRENSEQFRSDLRELNQQFEADPDSLGPSAKARLKTWTQRAITDYTQNSFDPEDAYLKQFGKTTPLLDPNGNPVPDGKGGYEQQSVPLGLDDYSPTNVRDFVDAQIQTLTEELPFADRGEIIKQIGTKIQKSGLAVRFASGALPAKLKALAEQHRYDDEVARVERRSTILKGITDSGGVAEYAFDTLFEKFQKRGVKLDEDHVGKLTKQLTQTVNKWKGFIPNWSALHKDTKKTYSIAIAEILSRANLDKDANFLWLDPDDFPLSGIGSTTGDMTGIKKNAALTAILGHINPYGGSTAEGALSNMQIIEQLQGNIVKSNETALQTFNKTVANKKKISKDSLPEPKNEIEILKEMVAGVVSALNTLGPVHSGR